MLACVSIRCMCRFGACVCLHKFKFLSEFACAAARLHVLYVLIMIVLEFLATRSEQQRVLAT